MLKRFFTLSLFALVPSAVFAQRDAKVPDSDPEIERKSFIVAPGFEVNLYAADPLLAKPIQMNWDPQGRLWVATSETYPQILPGQKTNDKIIILEDTKGVGVADKTTVFADGLLIPTGVVPGDGGAYVANSTEIVHFSASKPGGKADIKRVLLSGFGTEDTHHIIHTFRWGPESDLYFNQSIYIHSHIETPAGVKHLNAGGIWRYNTGKNDLNVFARGWVNSWGHAFNHNGESFATDGAGGEGINHVVPGGYYMTSSGPHASRILHGLNPGSPKHCGLEILSGRHLPDDWQSNLITNDFRGHRVCRFVLSEDGSTFSSREMPELIKTNHPAFRPIDVKMGPDGAIYIADWYNPIIQHGEVDFRDPRRDKTHGRIWRISAKNRPLVAKPKLVGASIPEVIERLKDPEDWTRAQARRVLKERAKEVTPAMIADFVRSLPSNADSKTTKNNPLHEAVWLAEALEMPQREWLETLATSPNHQDRLMAARNAGLLNPKPVSVEQGQSPVNTSAAYALLKPLLKDAHARIRLEAVRTLATMPSQASAELALSILDSPMDPTLDYSLWLTLRELESIWLPAFQKGDLTFGGDPRKIAFALTAAQSPDAVKPLARLIEGGKLPPEKAHDLYLVLARIGGPDELASVLKRANDGTTAANEKQSLINAVVDTVRARKSVSHRS
ncbi:MAG: PVC-type heme-binding CxxCH protein [Gemmataceae bacterium]